MIYYRVSSGISSYRLLFVVFFFFGNMVPLYPTNKWQERIVLRAAYVHNFRVDHGASEKLYAKLHLPFFFFVQWNLCLSYSVLKLSLKLCCEVVCLCFLWPQFFDIWWAICLVRRCLWKEKIHTCVLTLCCCCPHLLSWGVVE